MALIGFLAAEFYYPIFKAEQEKIHSSPVMYGYKIYPHIKERALFSEDLNCMQLIKEYHLKQANNTAKYLPECLTLSIPYDHKIYVLDFNVGDDIAEVAFYYQKPEDGEKLYRGYVYNQLLNSEKPSFIKNE